MTQEKRNKRNDFTVIYISKSILLNQHKQWAIKPKSNFNNINNKSNQKIAIYL